MDRCPRHCPPWIFPPGLLLPVAAGLVGDEDALEIALRLKALADPVRVKLVSLLFSSDVGELCSCDLASAVDLSESTVSHHLSQLRRAGLYGIGSPRHECLPPPAQGLVDRTVHGARPELLSLALAQLFGLGIPRVPRP